MATLSPRVEKVGRLLFPPEGEPALRLLLDECSEKLPMVQTIEQIERIQLGVLRMSEGDVARLQAAVRMARIDWRDVLMNSGFGYDLQAHLRWADELGA